jgi:hypothetical protein
VVWPIFNILAKSDISSTSSNSDKSSGYGRFWKRLGFAEDAGEVAAGVFGFMKKLMSLESEYGNSECENIGCKSQNS